MINLPSNWKVSEFYKTTKRKQGLFEKSTGQTPLNLQCRYCWITLVYFAKYLFWEIHLFTTNIECFLTISSFLGCICKHPGYTEQTPHMCGYTRHGAIENCFYIIHLYFPYTFSMPSGWRSYHTVCFPSHYSTLLFPLKIENRSHNWISRDIERYLLINIFDENNVPITWWVHHREGQKEVGYESNQTPRKEKKNEIWYYSQVAKVRLWQFPDPTGKLPKTDLRNLWYSKRTITSRRLTYHVIHVKYMCISFGYLKALNAME